MTDLPLTLDELSELEGKIQLALATGDPGELKVLGYGEISTVVAVDAQAGRFAAKRLPRFDGRERYEAYAKVFHQYLEMLRGVGIQPAESHLQEIQYEDGSIVAYCVQSILDPDDLLPNVLAKSEDRQKTLGHLRRLFDLIFGSISDRIGVDSQLSNWAIINDSFVYIDITTPLLRDGSGKNLLDRELFMASLPAIFRPIVRAFVVDSIIAQYHDTRVVLLDLLANLYKEGLSDWIEPLIEIIGDRLEPRISQAEIKNYYQSDARMWAMLQWARRIDRWWQRHIRRRTYRFLLPGKIKR